MPRTFMAIEHKRWVRRRALHMVQPIRARIEEFDLTSFYIGGIELHSPRNIRARGEAAAFRLGWIHATGIVSFIVRRASSLHERTPFVDGSNNDGFVSIDAIEDCIKRKLNEIMGEPRIEMS